MTESEDIGTLNPDLEPLPDLSEIVSKLEQVEDTEVSQARLV